MGTSPQGLNKKDGFTIVELLIASAVFSVVLLVAIFGFLTVGRLFYKGVTKSQTQAVSQQVISDISANLQNATGTITIPPTTGNGYYYYCINGVRYTYLPQHQLDLSSEENNPNYSATNGNFGLLRDTLPSSTSCAAPCDPAGACPTGVALSSPTEMLGDNMRIVDFTISKDTNPSAGPDLYDLNLVIAYGDTALLTNPTDGSSVACSGGTGDEFCAVSRVHTSVLRGIHL